MVRHYLRNIDMIFDEGNYIVMKERYDQQNPKKSADIGSSLGMKSRDNQFDRRRPELWLYQLSVRSIAPDAPSPPSNTALCLCAARVFALLQTLSCRRNSCGNVKAAWLDAAVASGYPRGFRRMWCFFPETSG